MEEEDRDSGEGWKSFSFDRSSHSSLGFASFLILLSIICIESCISFAVLCDLNRSVDFFFFPFWHLNRRKNGDHLPDVRLSFFFFL